MKGMQGGDVHTIQDDAYNKKRELNVPTLSFNVDV
jgi:hypothetical protein